MIPNKRRQLFRPHWDLINAALEIDVNPRCPHGKVGCHKCAHKAYETQALMGHSLATKKITTVNNNFQ